VIQPEKNLGHSDTPSAKTLASTSKDPPTTMAPEPKGVGEDFKSLEKAVEAECETCE
jgi:hypothetical protein